MNTKHLERFTAVAEYAQQQDIPFYCITSSSSEVVSEFKNNHLPNIEYAHADERVLKTMVRANPGLMLLKNGTVINKWDDSQVPEGNELNESINEAQFSKIKDPQKNNALKLSVILLILVVPLGILKFADKKDKFNIKN